MKRILSVVVAFICLIVVLSGADCINVPVSGIVTPSPEVSAQQPVASSTPEASSTPSAAVTPTPTPQMPLVRAERLSVSSKYLRKEMKVNIYLPADYDKTKKYPVLYLLHGYGGNENDWENNLNLIGTASELFFSGEVEPYIIVAPDMDNSYGVNSSYSPPKPPAPPAGTPAAPSEGPGPSESTEPAVPTDTPTEVPISTPETTPIQTEPPAPSDSPEATPAPSDLPAPSNTPEATSEIEFRPTYGRYEYYLIKELIPYIDSNYSTLAQKEGRYIGGVSMGGFAALHLCFAHTDLFSKAGGHSPALWIYTKDPLKTNNVIIWLYPSGSQRKKKDPLVLAKSADLSGIKIWLDCGTRDFYGFNVGTKKLYDILVSREAQVEYNAFPGGHKDDYWKAHLKEYLTFYGT